MKVIMEPGVNGDYLERVIKFIESHGAIPSVDKGEEFTLVGVLAKDVSQVPIGQLQNLPGVQRVVPITSRYKEVQQIGTPGNFMYTQVDIGGKIRVGGEEPLIIAGPCSLENKAQIEDAARIVSDFGGNALRCGVKKWRTDWRTSHGPGYENLRKSLDLVVDAGRKFGLPTVVEVLSVNDIPVYIEAGVDCLQTGAISCKNQDLLYALAELDLPVLYKRGEGQKLSDYFIWATKLMKEGKNNVILCERGVNGLNDLVRNTPDLAAVPVMRYKESRLPVVVDPSHSAGDRDYVIMIANMAIVGGAQGIIVEVHPNPHVAKTDGDQTIYPEQFKVLVECVRSFWSTARDFEPKYPFTAQLQRKYADRIDPDKQIYTPVSFKPEDSPNQ